MDHWHHRIRFSGVIDTAELSSVVSFTPQNQTPLCQLNCWVELCSVKTLLSWVLPCHDTAELSSAVSDTAELSSVVSWYCWFEFRCVNFHCWVEFCRVMTLLKLSSAVSWHCWVELCLVMTLLSWVLPWHDTAELSCTVAMILLIFKRVWTFRGTKENWNHILPCLSMFWESGFSELEAIIENSLWNSVFRDLLVCVSTFFLRNFSRTS